MVWEISHDTVDQAWTELILRMYSTPKSQWRPTRVSISSPGSQQQDDSRKLFDDYASRFERVCSSRVTASTIFPAQLWSLREPHGRGAFYDYYNKKYYPRLKTLDQRNTYGTYFQRLIDYTGIDSKGNARSVNQVEHVISLFGPNKAMPRRTALQMNIFDPAKDHSGQVRRGFPCLHSVSINHSSNGLELVGRYPTEYVFDRAYGNYVGLCDLAKFIAEGCGQNLAAVHCDIEAPILSRSKQDLSSLISELEKIFD